MIEQSIGALQALMTKLLSSSSDPFGVRAAETCAKEHETHDCVKEEGSVSDLPRLEVAEDKVQAPKETQGNVEDTLPECLSGTHERDAAVMQLPRSGGSPDLTCERRLRARRRLHVLDVHFCQGMASCHVLKTLYDEAAAAAARADAGGEQSLKVWADYRKIARQIATIPGVG